jgi:hypothetical protein
MVRGFGYRLGPVERGRGEGGPMSARLIIAFIMVALAAAWLAT